VGVEGERGVKREEVGEESERGEGDRRTKGKGWVQGGEGGRGDVSRIRASGWRGRSVGWGERGE